MTALKYVFPSLALCLLPLHALANWQLNNEASSLTFISTKNVNISEQHSFDRLSGTITPDGKISINVDISSLNTMIPIRNERMQKMLFKASEYANAKLIASIDPATLALAPGETVETSVQGELHIAGQAQTVSFSIRAVGLKAGGISAYTAQPTIINAAQWQLESGVEALREVAGLANISLAVPLSFAVVFEKSED